MPAFAPGDPQAAGAHCTPSPRGTGKVVAPNDSKQLTRGPKGAPFGPRHEKRRRRLLIIGQGVRKSRLLDPSSKAPQADFRPSDNTEEQGSSDARRRWIPLATRQAAPNIQYEADRLLTS